MLKRQQGILTPASKAPASATSSTKIPMKQQQEALADQVVRSMADDIFQSLCNEGCNPKDIIGISSQLLALVTTELKSQLST